MCNRQTKSTNLKALNFARLLWKHQKHYKEDETAWGKKQYFVNRKYLTSLGYSNGTISRYLSKLEGFGILTWECKSYSHGKEKAFSRRFSINHGKLKELLKINKIDEKLSNEESDALVGMYSSDMTSSSLSFKTGGLNGGKAEFGNLLGDDEGRRDVDYGIGAADTKKLTDIADDLNSTNRSAIELINYNGNRALSNLNLTKAHDLDGEKSMDTDREQCLAKIFPDGHYEFDIHSAIPSVIRLMNKGIWDSDWDPKTEVAKTTGLPEKTVKRCFMRTCFDKSLNSFLNHIHRLNSDTRIKECDKIRLTDDELMNIHRALIELTGFNASNEQMFIHESNIELMTVKSLREAGFYTVNVYDCFYSEAAEKTIKEHLNKSAAEYYADAVKTDREVKNESKKLKNFIDSSIEKGKITKGSELKSMINTLTDNEEVKSRIIGEIAKCA